MNEEIEAVEVEESGIVSTIEIDKEVLAGMLDALLEKYPELTPVEVLVHLNAISRIFADIIGYSELDNKE